MMNDEFVNTGGLSTVTITPYDPLPSSIKLTAPAYKFEEDATLAELKAYIDSTYSQHYSRNKFQATEFIIDGGHGTGFCIGNIMKYAQRYGKKNGKSKPDLLKILHYAIIMMHVHNLEERNLQNETK